MTSPSKKPQTLWQMIGQLNSLLAEKEKMERINRDRILELVKKIEKYVDVQSPAPHHEVGAAMESLAAKKALADVRLVQLNIFTSQSPRTLIIT